MVIRIKDLFYFSPEKEPRKVRVIDKCNIYFKELMFQMNKENLCSLIQASNMISESDLELKGEGLVSGSTSDSPLKVFFDKLLVIEG